MKGSPEHVYEVYLSKSFTGQKFPYTRKMKNNFFGPTLTKIAATSLKLLAESVNTKRSLRFLFGY